MKKKIEYLNKKDIDSYAKKAKKQPVEVIDKVVYEATELVRS